MQVVRAFEMEVARQLRERRVRQKDELVEESSVLSLIACMSESLVRSIRERTCCIF